MTKLIRPIRFILFIGFLMIASLVILNLDLFYRTYHSVQSGTFTIQRLRYDVASYDIDRSSSVIPIKMKISARDGMVQAIVPAGEFLMGRDSDRMGDAPRHRVYLDAYWVDQVEVTNTMFARCVSGGACHPPAVDRNPYYGNWAYRDYPVVYVSWFQAGEYCKWAGRDLPTEAQWEKAARGTDGRIYPWGDSKPNPRMANFSNSLIYGALPAYRYPLGASPYDAFDMAGNVREWVSDWFSRTYYLVSPYKNPRGPESGTERSLRGGSYDEAANEITTFSRYRHEPASAGLNRGFRCVEMIP